MAEDSGRRVSVHLPAMKEADGESGDEGEEEDSEHKSIVTRRRVGEADVKQHCDPKHSDIVLFLIRS